MPFTVEQFIEVFARYNLAVWPMQVVLIVLGLGAIDVSLRAPERRLRSHGAGLVTIGFAVAVRNGPRDA